MRIVQESIRKRLAALESQPFGDAPVGILLPSGDGFELTHGSERFRFQTEQEGIDFFNKRTRNLKSEPILIYWGRGTGDE